MMALSTPPPSVGQLRVWGGNGGAGSMAGFGVAGGTATGSCGVLSTFSGTLTSCDSSFNTWSTRRVPLMMETLRIVSLTPPPRSVISRSNRSEALPYPRAASTVGSRAPCTGTCTCTLLPQVPGLEASRASPIAAAPLSFMRAIPSVWGAMGGAAPELEDSELAETALDEEGSWLLAEALELLDVLDVLALPAEEAAAPLLHSRTTIACPPPLAKKSRTEYPRG